MSKTVMDFIKRFHLIYKKDLDDLGEEGIKSFLNNSNKYALESVLNKTGFLTFPHTKIKDCGNQVAEVVNACLNTSKEKIIFVGTYHTATKEMLDAKNRVLNGITTVYEEPLRGIYGIIDSNLNSWKEDHCYYAFDKFLEIAAKEKGVKKPELIKVFPFLVGDDPGSLDGIELCKQLFKNSAIVSTGDMAHHGIGYRNRGYAKDLEEIYEPDISGINEITKFVKTGFDILINSKYSEFHQHCARITGGDWADCGVLLHHLIKPNKYSIIETGFSDFSNDSIYNDDSPTWVISTLTKWEK
ncbi:MAG: hypothetical protein GY756_06790 [bacterium]|nr:hypothetical protein [bacterium]